MNQSDRFAQLQLLFTDPIQYDYEIIRPIVLFAEPVADRSFDTDMPRSTVSRKAKVFAQEGMLGLADKRAQATTARAVGYSEPIARYIHYLKHLYPPIKYREIARILGNKFGEQTNYKKVQRFLKRNPVTIQLELGLEAEGFHDMANSVAARWQVVRMFYEGWNQNSIAGLLKLSRQHVARLVESFEQHGFEGLQDKRSRPENHPHNQMTLPFMERVFRAQLRKPDAGQFRLHGMLEQRFGDETPSETTVGRAMQHNRFWRGAPHPLGEAKEARETKESAELPFEPTYPHQYWFIDIRYLVQLDKRWVYSICIIEGVSRTILAGMVSWYQDEIAILQLLHAAFSNYGLPTGIVSDNGSVFKAEAFMRVMEGFSIEPCPIEPGQPWQNLIESQFNVQRRLADADFKRAESFEEIQNQHAAFTQLFNTTRHWAHRNREDKCFTPVSVLGGRFGRQTDPYELSRVFRHLQFSRVVNRHGNVSVQRFYIYAERGLSKKRVAIWIYKDRLHVEYEHTLLAKYHCKIERSSKQLEKVTKPQLYATQHVSTQNELFELDDEQWKKVLRRPEYAKRRKAVKALAKQLELSLKAIITIFWSY